MSRFFSDAGTLSARTKARAADVEAKEAAVGTGFDAVQTELDRALRLATSDVTLPTMPALSTLKGKVLGFNGATGAPEPTSVASSTEMTAAVAAAASASASASAAAASAASVAGATNALHLLLLQNGVI